MRSLAPFVTLATNRRSLSRLANLPTTRPVRTAASQEADTPGCPRIAFILALLSIVTILVISANTLVQLGVRYSGLGGNPLVKIHPATYLAVFAAMAALTGGRQQGLGLGYLFSKTPALLVFFCTTVFCALYSVANVGATGAGVYIDTYLSAGCLALATMGANDRQRAIIARVVLTICIINVFIALAESIRQEHFIPMQLDGKNVAELEGAGDFRPAALYGHPLAGAMATSFGMFLFLTLDMGFLAASICFGILGVGLLAFGGRAALVVTVGLIAGRTVITLARDSFQRRVNGRLLGASGLAMVIMLPLSAYLLSATPIGERIVNSWYYDASAEVRVDQWSVLDHLTTRETLFGTPEARLEQVYYQVGLNGVENPFILLFLNLGIIGLPVFATGLLAFGVYLYRTSPNSGWLLFAAMLILSGSNSIGVKAPDLLVLTACAMGMPRRYQARFGDILRVYRPQFSFPSLRAKGLARDVQVRKDRPPAPLQKRGLSAKVIQRSRRPGQSTTPAE
jgi:hypothetical protein